jgi:hypothetical protein
MVPVIKELNNFKIMINNYKKANLGKYKSKKKYLE